MLQNTLFLEDAEEDLEHFLKGDKRKRVLIFPPVNNYRRFLIHQLVQDRHSDLLQTFSIGQGFARRTVVCYKSDFIGPPKVNGDCLPAKEIFSETSSKMGIESQYTPTASPEHHKSRQVKSTPSYEVYRPPPARRSRLENSSAASPPNEQTSANLATKPNRQKRPDRAVYVPRHRRGALEVETSNVPIKNGQPKLPKENPKQQISRRMTNDQNNDQLPTTCSTVEIVENQVPITSKQIEAVTETNVQKEEIMTENPTPAISRSEQHDVLEATTMEVDPPTINAEGNGTAQEEKAINEAVNQTPCLEESDKRDRRKSTETYDNSNNTSEALMSSDSNEVLCDTNISDKNKSDAEDLNNSKIEQLSEPKKLESKSDKQSEKKIEQPLVSKVLVISSAEDKQEKEKIMPPTSPVVPMTPPEKKLKKVDRPKSKPAAPPAPPVKINRDECDWESLFDDNGDCLDPTLIEELTSSVGEVVIEKPKSNYKPFTRPVEVSNDEYAHVIEIYNFPSEFKSGDLAAVFSPFKSGGFELKWVDDTHCLGVFSSPLVAAEVLASDHPFVKTRPLSEATALSKSKVRKSSEFLQPYRTRPETCAALARRLVTKSLGVKLATAKQEREQEKIVLREAKEKRRLANKQREDVWEGIIGDKSSS